MNDPKRSLTPLVISAAMVLAVLGATHWHAGTWRAQVSAQSTEQAEARKSSSTQVPDQPVRTSRKASKRQSAGFGRLDLRLGVRSPTGSGIVAGHVEGVVGDYMPRRKGRYFAGVTMYGRSGTSKINSHTEATARIIYGHKGLAPGIDKVHLFSISDFLGPKLLGVGSAQPPRTSDIDLFNHSWISRDRLNTADVLRRIDYVVDTQDAIMVVGVDNLRQSTVPEILASAYNVIAVGQGKGRSSGGYTQVEGSGRCKPDVVAPGRLTSYSTPVVTAAAARLLETAGRHLAQADRDKARRAEVIKAVILAGATKPHNWQPEPGKPLDKHLGAGQIDVDRSQAILAAVATGVGGIDLRPGWAFEPLPAGTWHSYKLESDKPLGSLSVVLVWHRRVRGVLDKIDGDYQLRWLPRSLLADLDLQLLARDRQGNRRVVAQSLSKIDNVEHLYFTALEAGCYRLIVHRRDSYEQDWDYALAWWIDPAKAGGAGNPADPGEQVTVP